MKKKKILSTILIIIFLVAGTTTVVLYKLGDRIFDEVIDMQITEMEKILDTAESKEVKPSIDHIPAETPVPIQQSEQPKIAVPITSNAQPTSEIQIPATQSSNTTEIPAAKPIGSTEMPTAKADINGNQDLQITKDKLEDIKESVTSSDKMAAATLVLGKLSKSDINHLTQLSTGGITAQEKEEMKEIVYSRFTAAEVEKIKEMYIKYMKK
jgi:hypothetical protein